MSTLDPLTVTTALRRQRPLLLAITDRSPRRRSQLDILRARTIPLWTIERLLGLAQDQPEQR